MKYINSEEELVNELSALHGDSKNPQPEHSIYVDKQIRKEVLTSKRQGKASLNGTKVYINFKDVGGDVYKANFSSTNPDYKL